jgi:hypothetical protein
MSEIAAAVPRLVNMVPRSNTLLVSGEYWPYVAPSIDHHGVFKSEIDL